MGALDDLTGAIQESMVINFDSFNVWITYFLYGAFIVGVLYAVYIFTKYRYKVMYYPLMGDSKDMDALDIGKPKKDYGAFFKKRDGNEEFRLLFARKKLKPVPYNLIYPDGIYFLRKSNSEFQCIPRPRLGNPSVKIYTNDPGMDLWATVAKQAVANRTADEDVSRRNMLMTAGVSIACLIFVGVIIWFIMGLASQTIAESVSKTDQLVSAIQGFANQGGGAG